MVIEEIDAVGLESLKRRVRDHPDTFRPAIEPGQRIAILEAELGRYHNLIAKRRKRLAHDLFVGERSISFGRVEEGHPAFDGRADQLDRLLPVRGRTVAKVKAHAAEAERRDFETIFAECSFIHLFFSDFVFRD